MNSIIKFVVKIVRSFIEASNMVNDQLYGYNLGVCGLVAIADGDACSNSDGGIDTIWIADCDDINIETMTVVGNEITDITAGVATPFVKFIPADDNTSFYNQEGEREGNKTTFNQSLFGAFKGISTAKIITGNALTACCCLVVIVKTTTGKFAMMGIDYDATNGVRRTKEYAKATVSLLTDTGDNEDRLEVNINGVGRTLAPLLDIDTFTQAALDALTVNP